MSHIRSTGTKPEETVRKYQFRQGFRYHKNVKNLPGKPDIVLHKYRTVIFVNGCFWHMHNCQRGHLSHSHRDYWEPKIKANAERDRHNREILEADGWRVIVVWECELKKCITNERLVRLCEEIKNGISE